MQMPDSLLARPKDAKHSPAPTATAAAHPKESVAHRWGPSRRAFVLVLLCVVAALSLADRQLIIILITPIKHEFGVSDTLIGLLTGLAFAVVYVVAGLPIAYWSDRGSRRFVIATSICVWSVMTMLCGAAQSFAQLAAMRMGVAFGEAGCTPSSHSMIADLYTRENRAKAIGLYNAFSSIGVGVGLFAGGLLVAHFNWRVVFIIFGLPGLLLALVIRFAISEPPRGLSDTALAGELQLPLKDTLKWLNALRSFRMLALSAMLCAIVTFGLQAWAATFFIRIHGIGPAEVGSKLGMASIAGLLAGTLISGMVADHLSKKDLRWNMRIAAAGMLLTVPFSTAFLLTPHRNIAFVMYGFSMCFISVWATPIHALTQTVAKQRMRGLAAAIVAFFVNVLGYGLGPLIVGLLNDKLRPEFGSQSIRYSLLLLITGAFGAAIVCVTTNRTLLADYARAQTPLDSSPIVQTQHQSQSTLD